MPISFPSLTPDARPWRLDWYGDMTYPASGRQYSQPHIRVAMSPLLCDVADDEALVAADATDHANQVQVWMPIGSLPMLSIGDIWKDGKCVASPDYRLESFDSIEINPETFSFVKAGLALEDKFLLPLSEHPWHRKHTQAYCVCVTLPGHKRLIVPCLEMIRFYFGSSSKFISRLFTGPLKDEILFRKQAYDKERGHLHLWLAPGFSGASAEDIGRIARSRLARRAAVGIYSSCLKSSVRHEPIYPYTGFPFEGKTNLTASGIWLSFGKEPRSTFLAYSLRSCTFPFPFNSLSYVSDDRRVRQPAEDSSQGPQVGQTKTRVARRTNNKSVPILENADPGTGKVPRTRALKEESRFPDLYRKPVWREKVDATAAPEILIKRDDGSIEKAAFGESSGGEPARQTDLLVTQHRPTAVNAADLPKFVQTALTKLRSEGAGEACLLLPDGYQASVFSVPMVVDPDGVVDPRGFFTRSDGGQRHRKACFVSIGNQITLILEGPRPNSPHAVRNVPEPDPLLIASFLTAD